MYASLLLKIPSACERIPQGFRDRYYSQLLGILNLVVDPTVTKVLGEVKEIKTEWVGTEQLYYEKEGFRFGKPIKATGEEFTVFVEMRNFDLFYTWSTKFPPKMESPIPPPGANLKFIEALVNPLDFARVIRDQLPSATIAKIAIQSDRSILRRAAVESLSDQAILEEIASQDKDAEVRKQAVERLANLRHKK
jgi:hypothetical protein